MKATAAWCSRIFREHNKECFEKIFGYTLPDILIMTSNTGKYNLGQFWHNDKQRKALCIVVNDKRDFSMENLRSVILHEMVHYYLFLHDMEKESHDKDFTDMMDKINAIYPDKISVVCDEYIPMYVSERMRAHSSRF